MLCIKLVPVADALTGVMRWSRELRVLRVREVCCDQDNTKASLFGNKRKSNYLYIQLDVNFIGYGSLVSGAFLECSRKRSFMVKHYTLCKTKRIFISLFYF